MTIKPMPDALMDLLSKLDVVASIQPNQKLNVSSSTYSDTLSRSIFGYLVGVFHRHRANEGRTNLLLHLDKLIKQSIEALHYYKEEYFQDEIIKALSNVKVGLENIKITYQNDPDVISRLNIFLRNIDIQLNWIFAHKTSDFSGLQSPVPLSVPLSSPKYRGNDIVSDRETSNSYTSQTSQLSRNSHNSTSFHQDESE